MKKYLIAMLLVMAVLLTACGNNAPAEEKIVTTKPAATEAAETEPAETEPALEERDVTLGRMEGDSYVNEYAGYAVDLSGGWVISSAEELQELPEKIDELLGDSELTEGNDSLEQFTDVLAENAETLQTINLLYRRVSLQERLGYAVMSEADILEGILEMQDQLVDTYAQAGILVEKMELVDITFLGEARKAIRTTTTIQDIPYITLQIFEFNRGKYALTLTLASCVEDTTESMLDLFSKVG